MAHVKNNIFSYSRIQNITALLCFIGQSVNGRMHGVFEVCVPSAADHRKLFYQLLSALHNDKQHKVEREVMQILEQFGSLVPLIALINYHHTQEDFEEDGCLSGLEWLSTAHCGQGHEE